LSPLDWRAKHSSNTHVYAYPFYSPILLTGTNRLGSACTHLLSSILDSSHDVLIACAAADIALESLTNLFFCWIGIIFEQLIRGHNHTWRAEAALQTMLLPEALLNWVQTSLRCKPLNGCHFTTICLHCQYRTGFDGFAIEQHGAGSTLRGVAADVRTCEV